MLRLSCADPFTEDFFSMDPLLNLTGAFNYRRHEWHHGGTGGPRWVADSNADELYIEAHFRWTFAGQFPARHSRWGLMVHYQRSGRLNLDVAENIIGVGLVWMGW